MLMLKVGGGHMFTHRLVLEHFAGLPVSGTRRSYEHHGLQTVDIRPTILLERTLGNVNDTRLDIIAIMSYTGSVLSADT